MTESMNFALALEHMRTSLDCLAGGQGATANILLSISLSSLSRKNGTEMVKVRRILAPVDDPKFAFFDEMTNHLF